MTEWSPGTAPTTTWEQEAGMLPSGPGVEDNISNLVERAETAAASAEAAETNAETAEANAETAQAASEAAQTAAESAQTAAETAETNAEASATSATSSANAAASSASAASTSESNASTSETNASNSASAASSSASSASSAQTAAESARDDAEAAFDSFDDRYLGAKSSEPALDNDGEALIEGALYYDTTDTQLYVYNGSAWDAAALNVNEAVTSFNTRIGDITLTESDVTTALGFTPADIAGDTFTGDLAGTNLTLSGYLRGPSSFVIDPATHGDDTGTLVIAGNLQVDGTTTTINSTTVTVDDLNLTLASGAINSAAADGAGISIDGASVSFAYDNANSRMALNTSMNVTGTLSEGGSAVLKSSDIGSTVQGYDATTLTSSDIGSTVQGYDADTALLDTTQSFTATQTFTSDIVISSTASINEVIEKCTINTSTTGTFDFDALSQAVVFLNTAQTANRTLNFRGDGSTSLDTLMSTGESMTFAVLATQGATAYYFDTIQIDGTGVTPKWQGGTAPTEGNASGIDSYSFTVIKTGSATFTVLASQTQFA